MPGSTPIKTARGSCNIERVAPAERRRIEGDLRRATLGAGTGVHGLVERIEDLGRSSASFTLGRGTTIRAEFPSGGRAAAAGQPTPRVGALRLVVPVKTPAVRL